MQIGTKRVDSQIELPEKKVNLTSPRTRRKFIPSRTNPTSKKTLLKW